MSLLCLLFRPGSQIEQEETAFRDPLFKYLGAVLTPFGDFACFTIPNFSPFPELINQQKPNSS